MPTIPTLFRACLFQNDDPDTTYNWGVWFDDGTTYDWVEDDGGTEAEALALARRINAAGWRSPADIDDALLAAWIKEIKTP